MRTIEFPESLWISWADQDERVWRDTFVEVFNSQIQKIIQRGLLIGFNMVEAEINGIVNPAEYQAIYEALYMEQGQRYYEYVKTKVKSTPFKLRKKELPPNDPYFLYMQEFIDSITATKVQSVEMTSREAAVNAIRKVTEEVTAEGLGIDEASKLIQERVLSEWRILSEFRAQRIARTEVTALANRASYYGAQTSGVNFKKQWMAYIDSRTRPSHKAINGTTVGPYEFFNLDGTQLQYPGQYGVGDASETINCYLPDTTIENSGLISAQKSYYTGQAVEIITASGKRLAVTPNHPIITDKLGWVAAKDIKVGNYVLSKRNGRGLFYLLYHYVQQKVFTATNIFSSINILGIRNSVMAGALNFNGDGKFMHENINIVYPKSVLRRTRKSEFINVISYIIFIKSLLTRIFIGGFSAFNFFRSGNNPTLSGFMCLMYLSFSLCFRHLRPFKKLRLGSAPSLDTYRFQPPIDSISTTQEMLTKFIDTHSAIVHLDKVVQVNVFNYSGHVYDFENVDGINISNNIFSSNCRCRLGYVIE